MKREYEDNRDWKEYNNTLIRRGEFYIDPIFLNTWNKEIKNMNHRKEGSPYMYPNSMIEFLAILHAKSFDYRALQGIMKSFSRRYYDFPIISYTQICRRINNFDAKFITKSNKTMGVDGSGIKVTNRGDWMRKMYSDKKKRGWIKVVILGDTKGNIVDVEIGDEKFDERSSSRGLIKKHSKKIKKLLADGLHDSKETFDLCRDLDIKPVIKIRKNASGKADGSMFRAKHVKEYKKLGHENWVKRKCYGMRWVATEGIFSAVKRMFGEYVRATSVENMYHEAKLKFWAYDQIKSLA